MNGSDHRRGYLLWALLLLPLLWLAAALAWATAQAHDLAGIFETMTALLSNPFAVHWCSNTPKFLLVTAIVYPLAIAYYYADQADQYPGAEHGSARWGNVRELDRRYRNRADPQQNYIFTKHIQMGMDVYRHFHNLNVMVIGGSGAGKTRFYVEPNAMMCACSYIFLDPKGELLRKLGHLYEQRNIPVTVIDLVHFKGHYNPMAYLQTDEDAIKLAHALVTGTQPKDSHAAGDKFWDNSAELLISALLLYLMYEAPPEEQNLFMLMYMITNCQVTEGASTQNPLELLFSELEERDPEHPAVLQFKSFKLGCAKTLQSVLITAAANLYMFNSRRFAEMTSRDEAFLPQLGLEKRVIFCIIPDNDTTFNFLVTILYTQLFDQLFRLADSDAAYGGALPVHVRLMMDEFANVALPSNFKNILSVCRSRNLSCDIILQNIAQLKSLFKDDWEGIVGNCDTLLYLGGNEYGTFEYLSKIMGKQTERTKSTSIGKGSHGSSSESQQKAGRELATPDEIRRMKRGDALLLMSGEDPVIDRKYNVKRHPNARFTTEGGGKPYVLPADYMSEAVTLPAAELATVTAEEIPRDILDHFEILNLEDLTYETDEIHEEE